MLINLSNLYLIQNAARPNLLKEILFENPFVLPLLGTIAVVYILVLFNYLDKDRKLSYWLERTIATAYIFLISGGGSGISMNPFNRLFPGGLASSEASPTLKGILIAIYALCLLLLAGRLRHSLKKYIYSIAILAQADPGLMIILFLNLFSASWSQTPENTLSHSLVLIMISLVAIYIGNQFSWTEIHFMLRWVAAFIIILSLRNQGIGADGNWTGILIHKNPFSFEMSQGVIWWLLQAFYQPEYRRRSLLFFTLCLFGLQKGGSGASKVIIIILVGLWGYVGILKKLPVKWAFVSVVVFLILGVNVTIWVSDNIQFIIVDKLNKDITLTGRTEFWPQIWESILQNPMGFGTASYFQPERGADNPAFALRTGTGFRPPNAHNGVLQMGTEIGFIGMGCFIISFFSNLSRAVIHLSQTEQPEASIPLQLITYLIMTNLTESNFMGINSLWFLYIVMSTRFSIDIQGGMTKNDKLRKQKLRESKAVLRSG